MKAKDDAVDAIKYSVPQSGVYQVDSSNSKYAAVEAAVRAMEEGMRKKLPTYLPGHAEVDPKLLGILPDPSGVPAQTLRFNVARPVDRNFRGDVISHPQEDSALVFEKILVKDPAGNVLGVSWRQVGFNLMAVPENRAKFVKEAFGLTDAEIQELLSVQQG